MLRNATMRGNSGTIAAVSASTLRSCASASPTISNWRSTADRSKSSTAYASNDLSDTNWAIRSAAWSASQRYLRDSGRIDAFARCREARAKIWVYDRTGGNQVHLPIEEGLKSFLEGEVGIGIGRWRNGFELDEKIEIARCRIEIAPSGRTRNCLQRSATSPRLRWISGCMVCLERDHHGEQQAWFAKLHRSSAPV